MIWVLGIDDEKAIDYELYACVPITQCAVNGGFYDCYSLRNI